MNPNRYCYDITRNCYDISYGMTCYNITGKMFVTLTTAINFDFVVVNTKKMNFENTSILIVITANICK